MSSLPPTSLLPSSLFFVVFGAGSHFVDQAGLELTVQFKLASDSSCLNHQELE